MLTIRFQHGEQAIGWVMLILGIGVATAGWMMPAGMDGAPGPGFLPTVAGSLLAVCALALIAKPAAALDAKERDVRVKLFPAPVTVTLLALAAVAVVFERTSMIVSLSGLLAGLHWVYGNGPWWKSLIFGLGGAWLAWFVFVYVLSVSMPGF
jgi:hypothetical protein